MDLKRSGRSGGRSVSVLVVRVLLVLVAVHEEQEPDWGGVCPWLERLWNANDDDDDDDDNVERVALDGGEGELVEEEECSGGEMVVMMVVLLLTGGQGKQRQSSSMAQAMV